MSDLKIGSIVEFFPGNVNTLPNGMQTAPAIVTQIFGETGDVKHANLTVFTADPTGKENITTKWSVFNKKHPVFQGNEGCPHFDY